MCDGDVALAPGGRAPIPLADTDPHYRLTEQDKARCTNLRSDLTEQINYWRGQLDEQTAAGTYQPWTRGHIQRGDLVKNGKRGDWHEVTRVNAKTVTVPSAHRRNGVTTTPTVD